MVQVCPKCGHQWAEQKRTTGKFSQNHAIWGFAEQIARSCGDSTDSKSVIEEAARRASIPSAMNSFQRIVYLHESSWTKDQASKVIEALREIARDMDVRLVEVNA